jgi:hypothetical protein
MSRGGKRSGAGRKKSTDSSVVIRVPATIKNIIKQWIQTANQSKAPAIYCQEDVLQSITILESALKLKANAGGKIKIEIRKVIEILQQK